MDDKISLGILAASLAQSTGKTKKQCEDFLREFFRLVSENIEIGEPLKIKGFGTFKIVEVESRMSVNINTGEKEEIPAYKKVVFTPAKELASAINAPFEEFESVEMDDEMPEEYLEETDEPAHKEEDCEEEEEKASDSVFDEKYSDENDLSVNILEAGSEEEGEDDDITLEAYGELNNEHSEEEKHENSFDSSPDSYELPEEAEESEEKIESQESQDAEKSKESKENIILPPPIIPVVEERKSEPIDNNFGSSEEMRALQEEIEMEHKEIQAQREEQRIQNEEVQKEIQSVSPDRRTYNRDVNGRRQHPVFHKREPEPAKKSRFGIGFLTGSLVTLVICVVVFMLGCFFGWWPIEFGVSKELEEEIDAMENTVDNVPVDSTFTDTLPPASVEISQPIYDTVSTTRYLTTIARDHYGNYNYWPYIYLENQSVLGHPDRITPGTKVVVPDLKKYGVDVSNPNAVQEAKKKAQEIYAKFK